MKKFILHFLLQLFIFITVHDYVINEIDRDTQNELLMLDLGLLTQVCDITKDHQLLHDHMLTFFQEDTFAIESCLRCSKNTPIKNLFHDRVQESIYHPPIA